MPAGEQARPRPHRPRFAAADVGNFDFPRGLWVALVTHPDHGAVQPQSRGRVCVVEPGVVEPRRHRVFHGGAIQGPRQQSPHQQPGHRRVAVGEVEDVGLFFVHLESRREPDPRAGLVFVQPQPGEPRELESPAIERRHGIDAYAVEIVGARLEVWDRLGRDMRDGE